ncbi:MAG: 1-acyl-sn-glycerol-3-phosphate acyltransferase, partial [Proteobacteria bacterium]
HVFSGVLALPFLRDPWRRRRHFVAATARHSRWVMRLLNIHMPVDARINANPKQNYLIVANHMSYLDAILVASFRPSAFVTSMEMKNSPGLGQITDTGGCLYVERRSKENIYNEIGQIEEALKRGFDVVVFPEATSTDGSALRGFKRPLFAAAVKAGVPVLPVVLQYEYLDGVPVTKANRDALCWYGSMSFAGHFLGLMKYRRIDMRLTVLPALEIKPESSRDTLMDAAFTAISEQYRPIV